MHSPALAVARERIAAELVAQTGKLDLSRLRLTELPAELKDLTHLHSLDCSSTWVSDLTPLRRLSHLQRLRIIQCTWLKDLEPLRSITNLQSLDCDFSDISDLTPLRGLTNLQSLEISCTPVSDLSPLSGLTNLQNLDCSGTYVIDLTPVRSLVCLQSLRCSDTKVKDLTPLQNLRSLQRLDCDGTQVSDLAPLQGLPNLHSFKCHTDEVIDLWPLRYISSLQSLDISSARFTNLSALQGLTNLQNLDCSFTELSDLSPLRSLTKLQSLKCYHTDVNNLEPLQNLTNLYSLECHNTQVCDLSPLRHLRSLRKLDCQESQVSDLRPLQDLVNLEFLSCRSTNVSDLSPLQQLLNLKKLDCSCTEIDNLAPLKDLINLEGISFSCTKVSDLSALTSLMSLRSLTCIGTAVSDLSPMQGHSSLQDLHFAHAPINDLTPLKDLIKLKFLNVDGTQVSDLTPLQKLRNLESLSCEDTKVNDLSPLADLQALFYLNCKNNKLIEFPRKLLLSPELQNLELSGTTIQGVPQEILSIYDSNKRLANLRAHIRDLEVAAIPVNRVKILVLGNGGVGKTQLCRHLAGESFDPSVPSTHGIHVRTIAASTTEEVSLTLWDFGGQDIYHSAHTLFMRTAAVFLVVWTPEQDELVGSDEDDPLRRRHPLSYWLEYVSNLGPADSPVVVVQSQCDQPDQAVLLPPVDPDLLESFSCLRCCSFSARSKRGTATLQEALRDATDFLVQRDGISSIGRGRHLVWQQLETWREADQQLPARQRLHRTLSQQEFAQLCGQIGGVSCPKALLLYLHNKGVVFHRRELFLDRIILDQSWALDAVYAVFDRASTYQLIKADDGRFSPSLLAATIWQDYEPEAQRLFISLMLSCGIIFPHRPADASTGLEAQYLAPDLLPPRSSPQVSMHLQGRWDGHDPCLMLTYRYSFLHDGLVRALLCDVGNHAGDAGVYWRYGAWVYDAQDGCIALLEQQMLNDHEGEISIRFQGTASSALAQWFSQRLAERNRQFGYPHLQPKISGPLASPNHVMGQQQHLLFNDQDEDGEEMETGEEKQVERTTSNAIPPKLSAAPAETFHKSSREVFISYAHGDQSPEGKERQRIVDEIAKALGNHPQQINVRIDRDELRPGHLISAFMDRLAAADRVIIVISDQYLRSEYCMYELFMIYQNCRKQADDFHQRIIPIILPDSGLTAGPAARFQRAVFWSNQETELKLLLADHFHLVGERMHKTYRLIGEFARNTSDMIEYLIDQLQPRDYERQITEGFVELCEQILAD